MKELAKRHKRYGSPRIHLLLKREGLVVNHKRTERIYREERLSIRRNKKKKLKVSIRIPLSPASMPNEIWSMDFLCDACANGSKIRILTIVDDFTRISPGLLVRSSVPGHSVTAFLDQQSLLHGYPRSIRVDHGPEFTGKHFQQWAVQRKIDVQYTRPGKPTDNAYIESFNGKLRDECLNEHWFLNLRHAQALIEKWRIEYNAERPHSSLGGKTPYEFVKEHMAMIQDHGLNLNLVHNQG